MLPALAGIVTSLVTNGLTKVAEAVVEKGVDAVSEKLGVDLTPKEDGNLSVEQIQQVKEAAMKHEEFMVEQELKNTTDARNMQIEALKQDDLFSKRFVYYFSVGWSIVASIYMFLATFLTIPPDNLQTSYTIMGFLLGQVISTMMSFFLGSTLSSKKTNEQMVKNSLGGK